MDANSTSSQDDPDPGPYDRPRFQPTSGSGVTGGSQSPQSFTSSPVTKKEKGRVRFNSNAALTNPPAIPPNVRPATPEHRDSPISRPRPSVLRGNSSNSIPPVGELGDGFTSDPADSEKAISAAAAQERARQIAAKVHRESPGFGSRASLESTTETAASDVELMHDKGIPLRNWGSIAQQGSGSGSGSVDEFKAANDEASQLVQAHARRLGALQTHNIPSDEVVIHAETKLSEVHDGSYDGVYNVPAPEHYRGSVLSQLLKLYKPPEYPNTTTNNNRHSIASSIGTPGSESGTATPNRKKWYNQNRSQETLANLIEASARLANPNEGNDPKSGGKKRPMHKRAGSASRLSSYWQQEEARITVHIAETLSRQEYVVTLCRALMLVGAPTHRLEEYLSMSARVLEIDGQFLYIPGCMIISFDDKSTRTTEVRIVRTAQGINLGKLKDVHLIYKEVMHDVIGVEEATRKLDELMAARDKFHAWFRVLIFGLTSAMAAPFSFKARLIDLPLCFLFGSTVGMLQLIVAPKSALYSNVFEVSATVLVSFLARAFGSIRGGSLFCFSAIAQGGIVMLLPGYLVLCSALELQSRAIVPGSIRIVYAVIYSLLLGFGITVGATLYGLFDSNPTSATTCENPLSPHYGFIFVPPFVICISILYQAKWRQMPVMAVIAFAGYIVNYFSSIRFEASPQIASTLGAFSVGVLANLYSRIRHGVAAATLIPAIFTQVPGGLAATGGLLSGLRMANEITNSDSPQPVNGTGASQDDPLNTVVFDVAASMIQIAIGIAVGLFLSALIIYPLGKRRSGLFSF